MYDYQGSRGNWVGAWSRKRADLSPNQTAVIDVERQSRMSYADLNERANRTARLLRNFDVEKGNRVATISKNRIECLDLCLASGKIGSVLAPLSHRLATDELAELLSQVDPELIIVEGEFEDKLANAARKVRTDQGETQDTILSLVDDGETRWKRYQDCVPENTSAVEEAKLNLDDSFMLLATGGSTGLPKETVLSYRSVYWNSFNAITGFGIHPGDTVPLLFPMFHTGGWNVVTIPTLHMGGTLVLFRDFDPGEILSVTEAKDATILSSVSTIFRLMAEHDAWERTDLSNVRKADAGGEPCRNTVIKKYEAKGITLTQGYGLTECGPVNFASPEDLSQDSSGSVGKPGMHVDARIVDEDGESVESGEVGELELAGHHAATGYWNNPEETEATFDDGWVSTGDLARVDDGGNVHIEGRKKNMFISGGENVYPEALEDAISDYPGVDEVIVISVPDEKWGQVGRGIIKCDDDVETERIEEFLVGRIADFKIPKTWVIVDEMPKSGPSKIDRKELQRQYGGDE